MLVARRAYWKPRYILGERSVGTLAELISLEIITISCDHFLLYNCGSNWAVV